VLDGDTNRDNKPSREEAPRVLNALIAATQRTIEESRMLIAKVNEILAKHR
jgi:hypothetical protein